MVGQSGDDMVGCDGGEVKGCVAHVVLLFVIVPIRVGSHIYFACFFAIFGVCRFVS